MKHRKLLPPSELTNSTVECPDFCDPSCPDKCYSYSDYFFLSPPPAPPSPPPHFFRHLSPYVIILVALLASFLFLLVSYYMIIAKSCPGWWSLRSRRRLDPREDRSDGDEFVEENQVDHPIWFINTTGLQQSVINSIAVYKYKKGEGLIEGTECSVCLGEFHQGEILRLLPKCSHAFHLSCIDTWLRSHTNCPLCRARILAENVSPSTSVSVDHNNPGTQMEDSHFERDLGNSQDAGDGSEDRTGGEGLTEITQIVDDRNSSKVEITQLVEERSTSKVEAGSVGNRDVHITFEYELLAATNSSQPMRRSSSMDLSKAASMYLVETDQSEGSPFTESESTRNTVITSSTDSDNSSSTGSCSMVRSLEKNPATMQRSVSCGGRFFASRQSRSINSILPS